MRDFLKSVKKNSGFVLYAIFVILLTIAVYFLSSYIYTNPVAESTLRSFLERPIGEMSTGNFIVLMVIIVFFYGRK